MLMIDLCCFLLFTTAQTMAQFPPGFQGANLTGFVGAGSNFATFRPQFSVPGQPSTSFP